MFLNKIKRSQFIFSKLNNLKYFSNMENKSKYAPSSPFHLAIPVHNLAAAKEFYGTTLGLKEGRSSEKWQDYDFFGNQFVCHWVGEDYRGADYYNPVDGDEVPVAHFGACLEDE